ncbi:MAG: hypothetical protein K0S14_2409, partial [Thermomicrobiales bacterium]|nr:hypothetical protein [Thermomicrobiales bacterium]
LLKQGYLTDEDLDTLSVDEAIAAARQRLCDQVAGLQEQSDTLTRQDRGNPDRVTKVPRTLRQG